MSYNDKFIDNFELENMKLREIKFPESLTKGKKFMKNIVIKPDKYTIYQISKDDIQELKYIPEHIEEGFTYLRSFKSMETFTPKWHKKDEWYAVLKNGKRIYLTEKQYTIIKGWF